MPALVTHYLHAVQTYDLLGDDSINKEAFCLGAQGPDFLYFHRALPVLQMGKSCRNIGTTLHQQQPDVLFSAFAEYILQHPEDRLALSYALGFLCHYSMDRICHPYVYFQQQSIIDAEGIKYREGCVHSRIEHNLDVIMLREKTGQMGNAFRPDKTLSRDPDVLKSAAAISGYVIGRVSDCKICEKQLIQAFNDTRFLQRVSYDPTSLKRAAVRVLEKLCFMPPSLSTFIRPMTEDDRWDYSNFGNGVWRNPFDADSAEYTDSFFDIFERSVEDSIGLIKRFMRQIENGESEINTTGNYSFKTGLVMKGT